MIPGGKSVQEFNKLTEADVFKILKTSTGIIKAIIEQIYSHAKSCARKGY